MKSRTYIKLSKNEIAKPKGDMFVVYFSSHSNNTARFVDKLGIDNLRIPIDLDKHVKATQDYVIICPTFAGGGEFWQGSVPKQVVNFLNDKNNREKCKGIIASGNTNFGETFALAGPVLSQKLRKPLLYQFELLGTKSDVENIRKVLIDFWKKEKNEGRSV